MNCKAFARLGAGTVALLVLALTPVAQAATVSPSPSPGPPASGISLRPLHLNPMHPAAYFTLHQAAGRSASGTVLVTNLATVPVTLFVSPVDGLTGLTTGTVYAGRGVPITRAGRWVSVTADAIHLAARSTQRVPFTVAVPVGASPGDHLAGIAFQNARPTTSGNGFKIREIVRNVIGVLVVVPGPAVFHPHLVSLGLGAIGSTGIGAVSVGLGDDGHDFAKPSLTVALSGPGGYHRTMTRQLDTVLPGDTVVFPYPWPDSLAKGTYLVKAFLTGGGVTVTLQKTVQLGVALRGDSPGAHVAKKSGFPWPTLIAVLVLALVLGLVIGLTMRRRPIRPVVAAAQ
jgi:hypothetical protein